MLAEGAERSDGAVITGRPGRWSSSKSLSAFSPGGAAADARYGPANCRIMFATLTERPRHCNLSLLESNVILRRGGFNGP